MNDDSNFRLSVTGKDLLKMIKELKPLLWFLAVSLVVVAIVWRLPEIIMALK